MIASYLITSPTHYSRNPITLRVKLEEVLMRKRVTMACLRDKNANNYPELARVFVQTLNSFRVKSIMHSDISLALNLSAYGVHLPFSLVENTHEAKKKGLFVIVSTHNEEDALYAQSLGADAVTFSPIFDTPNKGAPVGLEKLKEIIGILSIDVFALGGIISKTHIGLCEQAGAAGFASIRYFLPPLKR